MKKYSKISLLVVCALLFSVIQAKAQSWQQAVKEIKERVKESYEKKSKFDRFMEEEEKRHKSAEEKNITWEVIRELGELEYTPQGGFPCYSYSADYEKLMAYTRVIVKESDVKKRAFLDFVQLLLQKFDLVKDIPNIIDWDKSDWNESDWGYKNCWDKSFIPPIEPTGDRKKDKILEDARKLNDSIHTFGLITHFLLIEKSNKEREKNAFYNFYQTIVARKIQKQKISAIREAYRAQALELQKAFDFIPAKPEEAVVVWFFWTVI